MTVISCLVALTISRQAFVSYLRSVYLQKDKSIFKIDEMPVEKFSEALGLPGMPKIKFLSKEMAKRRKNASRAVEALVPAPKSPDDDDDSEDEQADSSDESSDEDEDTPATSNPAGEKVRSTPLLSVRTLSGAL